MTTEHILVVDDDRDIRSLLKQYLEKSGYRVDTAANADEMRQRLNGAPVSLIVLDVMMPGQDGLKACKEVRTNSNVPIILLTALAEPIERTIGLEMGADDYLGKPFIPQELLARIRAVLRRARGADSPAPSETSRRLLRCGWLLIDLDRQQVSQLESGAPVNLTSAEYRLLIAFLERPQRVIDRNTLLRLTHADEAESFDRSIDVLVSRLRNKLGDIAQQGRLIRTVRGSGYLLVEPTTAVDGEMASSPQSPRRLFELSTAADAPATAL